jgi:hypothetical protein
LDKVRIAIEINQFKSAMTEKIKEAMKVPDKN